MKNKKVNKVISSQSTLNPSLDKYSNVVLFPEKVERANRMLEKVILPKKK
jgi:hypothetical protein